MLYVWFAFSVLTAIAAAVRGRSAMGWWLLGLVFGFFALILVLIIPSRKRGAALPPTPKTHLHCPDCRELVLWDARVCKHCGCRLRPPPHESESPRRLTLLKYKP